MKALFYGGCHASVLRTLFARFGAPEDRFEQLVNFELMAAGRPVPWDWIATFDLIVFSPILHKPGYDTDELRRFCDRGRVAHVAYPWVEWRGYHPGLVRGTAGPGRPSWDYPALEHAALGAASLAQFQRQALEAEPDVAAVQRSLAETTSILVAHETAGGVDIRVSDFILARYRTERLFLTPDHPSWVLYRWLTLRIAERAGLWLDPAIAYAAAEPQPEERAAILPGVHRALDLAFRDADTRHDVAYGRGVELSFPEYLASVWARLHREARLLALTDTFVKPSSAPAQASTAALPVVAGTVLKADDVERVGDHLRLGRAVIGADILAGPRFLFAAHWRQM